MMDNLLRVEDPSDEHSGYESSGSEEWIPINIIINHRGTLFNREFAKDATAEDLLNECEILFNIPVCNQKILMPKGKMLKAPLKEPDMPLLPWADVKLTLLGSPAAEVEAVDKMAEKVAKRNAARQALAHKRRAGGSSRRNQARAADDAKYTFLDVRPLQELPHPETSQKLLLRLKEDPGIRATMRKHKFTVGLLTEMEPLAHTQSNHEGTSRILGLNRNQGEVIELRLRTDAHDGYRDYKTIRKTLCHELAHNVHGPHDRNFWDLCHQIEREVQGADWKSGGQTIGETSRYATAGDDEAEDHEDEGGWTGGEFVLGGSAEATAPSLSRREILAQAALERQRKEDKSEQKACRNWRPCQRPRPDDERK